MWKRQNYAASKKMSSCQARREDGAQRIFLTPKLPCILQSGVSCIMADICLYTSIQTHRIYNSKSGPNVNYDLWVMRCQGTFLNRKKCAIVVKNINEVEALPGGGVAGSGGALWGNLYFPLSFAVNLKLLYRIKSIFKK